MGEKVKTTEMLHALVHSLSGSVDADGGFTVPELWSQEIIELVREQSVLRSILPVMPIQSDHFHWPAQTKGVLAHRIKELGTAIDQNPTFEDREWIVSKLMVLSAYSTEIDEDAFPNIVKFLTDDMAEGIAISEETAFFNGETAWAGGTTAVVSDDPVGYQYLDQGNQEDARYAWDGLRTIASSSPVAYGGAFTLEKFRKQIAELEDEGYNPSHLFIHPRLAPTLKGLNELQRVDARGDVPGTINSRTIGAIDEVEIVKSRLIYTNLTAGAPAVAGVQTEAIMLDAKKSGIIADRRTLQMKTDFQIENDSTKVSATCRAAFNARNLDAINIGSGLTLP